jgi:serine phosphatase RsbU (regulator of sigma subunit)
MKIIILDRNIAVLEYFSFLLRNFNIITFTNKEDCFNYLENNSDIDFIFVEDFFYKDFLDKYLDAFLVILSFKIKKLEIKNRVYDYINKDITPLEFQIKFQIIKKLREYFLKEKKEKRELTDVLFYKELQEEMATQKQLKLFRDELTMFYENDFLIESFYKPKDILSGDALLTKRLDENKYFVAIIDAMGKGLSASLTSSNSVGFLSYVISEELNNNNFNFNKIIKNFTNYIKSILIEDEELSFVAGYIENNKFTYANFGMPPIYIDRKKFKPNNLPLSEWNENIQINEVEFQDDILMYSDGLNESETKDGSVYLTRFKELLPKFVFLNDIVKDFKKNAIQSDDTTIIYIKKGKFKLKKIYEKEIKIASTHDIDEFLKSFNIEIPKKEKIEFILQELLMNSYEHSFLKLKNLKNAFLKDNKLEIEKNSNFIKVKISIYESDKLIKVHYTDEGKGFDIDILKKLSKNKLHGRGI